MLGKEKEEMVQLRKRIEGVYLRRDRHTGELETTQTSKHTQTSADMQQNVSERLFFRTQHRSQKTGIEPALCTSAQRVLYTLGRVFQRGGQSARNAPLHMSRHYMELTSEVHRGNRFNFDGRLLG